MVSRAGIAHAVLVVTTVSALQLSTLQAQVMQIQFPPNLPSGGVYTFFVNPAIAVPPTSMVWGASTAASNPCATTGAFNGGVYTAPVITAVCNVVITAGVNGTQGAPLRASATVTIFPVSGNSAGPPGVSPVVAAESPGGNCAAGGVKITDAAGAATYVCNGPPGAPATNNPAAKWIYYETPMASNPTPTVYGTGIVLSTKCGIVAGTQHLYRYGYLFNPGSDYYVNGWVACIGGAPCAPMTLAANQMAALNFTTGPNVSPVPTSAVGYTVDYQYIPDASGNCP